MISYVEHAGLKIDSRLNKFLMAEILPGLDISEKSFWDGFAKTVEILGPRNRILLEKRESFQKQIKISLFSSSVLAHCFHLVLLVVFGLVCAYQVPKC